ncbi:MAG: hypothetical protein KTR29_07140 [Rhodothermaceae bacterium]|nr:hypothetical protein [Rhodothermaceae bacterium]
MRIVTILWLVLLSGCDSIDVDNEFAIFYPERIEQIRSLETCQSAIPQNTYYANEIIGNDSLITHSGQATIDIVGGASGRRWWGIQVGKFFEGWDLLFAKYGNSAPPSQFGTNSNLAPNREMPGEPLATFWYDDDEPVSFTMYIPVEWYFYTDRSEDVYSGEFWVSLEYIGGRDSGDASAPRIVFGCFNAS